MILKEENHNMKLELNKFKKKNDILVKDFLEMRRQGEEVNKSNFSNNMTTFYQVLFYSNIIYLL